VLSRSEGTPLRYLHDAVAATATLPATTQFTLDNAFPALLTTQSLLFAAVSAVVALSGPTPLGRRLAAHPVVLGAGLALMLTVVALGTGSAWWEIYGPNFPSAWPGRFEAIGLFVGFAVQPVVAFLIAVSLR
jgi:hypothetical protein